MNEVFTNGAMNDVVLLRKLAWDGVMFGDENCNSICLMVFCFTAKYNVNIGVTLHLKNRFGKKHNK